MTGKECGTVPGYRTHILEGSKPCPDCEWAKDCHVEASTAVCGTVPGWKLHNRLGEPKCLPCVDAMTKYNGERRRARGVKPRRKPQCGTPSGAITHYQKGEPVDEACRLAINAYNQAFRAKNFSAR